MVLRGAGLDFPGGILPVTRRLPFRYRIAVEKREFIHVDIALPGEPNRERSLSEQPVVRKIFAHTRDTPNAEITAEVIVDFGRGTRFADFLKVIDYQSEQFRSAIGKIIVDGGKRLLYPFGGLFVVQQIGVDELEEGRVQFGSLWK